MKRFLIFLICCFGGAVSAYAQKDSVNIPETPALPQGQYGTQRIPDPPDGMKEDRAEVQFDDLPPRMKAALEKEEIYAGWEEGNIFYERNTDQYLIHVVKGTTTHTFRFDKDGNPIRTESLIQSEETRH